MKYTLTILALFILTSLMAQDIVQELKKNKDITFIAKTTIYVTLETEKEQETYPSRLQLSGEQTDLQTIKLFPEAYSQTRIYGNHTSILTDLIFDEVYEKRITVTDEQGAAIEYEEVTNTFSLIDTFISFDEETFEETLEVAYNDEDRIKGYLVDVLWYYNQKKRSIYTQLLSYQLINEQYDGKKKLMIQNKGDHPLKQYHLSGDVIWSKAVVFKGFDLSSALILKGDYLSFQEEFFKKNIEKEEYQSYTTWWNEFQYDALTSLEYNNLLQSETDTFVSFDPVTFDEVVEVRKREAIRFDIPNPIQFVMIWNWNEQKAELSCELQSLTLCELLEDEDIILPFFKVRANNEP